MLASRDPSMSCRDLPVARVQPRTGSMHAWAWACQRALIFELFYLFLRMGTVPSSKTLINSDANSELDMLPVSKK